MRKLILAAALAAASLTTIASHAETIATIPNKAGGLIRLTDTRSYECTANGWTYVVYATGNTGAILRGCWRYIDEVVDIGWAGGARGVFELDNVTYTEYFLKNARARATGL